MSQKQSFDFQLVNEQVTKILQTPPFKSSRILTKFLKYIIAETLEGREQFLKEYVIATSVLGKDSEFNPQLDAIVRIHAGRLRNQLDKFYSTEGKNEPIKISIPKGRYIPVFVNNDSKSNVNSYLKNEISKYVDSKPKVAILPFAKINSNERVDVICSVLGSELSVELSKFQELNVISNFSIQLAQQHMKGLDEIIAKFDPSYIMMGTCSIDGPNLSVSFELHAMRNNQLIWAESYSFKEYESNKLTDYKEIIYKVVAKTCGFFGIIFRHTLTNPVPQDSEYIYAIYWYNEVQKQYSEKSCQEALNAIEIGLEKNPESSLLNSIKADFILDFKVMDRQGPTNVVHEGMKLALKALSLDHNNQHAWQTLGWANLLDHNKTKAIYNMEKCLSINPNNSMYAGSAGFIFVCAGEYEKGFELLSSTIQNPNYYWLVNAGLCLYCIKKNDFEEALFWAKIIKKPMMLWDPILRLACLGLLEKIDEAKLVLCELLELSPEFKTRGSDIVNTFILDEELQSIIIRGIENAGVELVEIPNFSKK